MRNDRFNRRGRNESLPTLQCCMCAITACLTNSSSAEPVASASNTGTIQIPPLPIPSSFGFSSIHSECLMLIGIVAICTRRPILIATAIGASRKTEVRAAIPWPSCSNSSQAGVVVADVKQPEGRISPEFKQSD
ncbi:hypothetical protein H6P81_002268 [Aristolochia fimbriata]|uniref:Uncharacterized protein n=1 Tax=Aristolochia fimbriata TaxID=158543 RepID=A0AAV7F9B9_ARIFI|nr:hypothetical protein H6P81_002268 [Aristolochia fimbriata]